jgi:hypothetical protein
MKKFIGGIFVGYTIRGTVQAYRDGAFERCLEVWKLMWESSGDHPLSHMEIFEYVSQMDTSTREPISELKNRGLYLKILRARIQLMHEAGKSNHEISETLGIDEDALRTIVLVKEVG